MQIHELNNFTGTLGSGAYLAVDDGNDTGKISKTQLFAATEARIDNIIAGPAPSAEEIVDARLGADGVTYPSLGDAIRDQVSDLKADINKAMENGSNLLDKDTLADDKYINNTNGAETAYTGWSASDYIEVTPTEDYLLLVIGGSSVYTAPAGTYYAFYDSSKQFVSGGITVATTPITAPAGSKYIRISRATSSFTYAMFGKATDMEIYDVLDMHSFDKVEYGDYPISYKFNIVDIEEPFVFYQWNDYCYFKFKRIWYVDYDGETKEYSYTSSFKRMFANLIVATNTSRVRNCCHLEEGYTFIFSERLRRFAIVEAADVENKDTIILACDNNGLMSGILFETYNAQQSYYTARQSYHSMPIDVIDAVDNAVPSVVVGLASERFVFANVADNHSFGTHIGKEADLTAMAIDYVDKRLSYDAIINCGDEILTSSSGGNALVGLSNSINAYNIEKLVFCEGNHDRGIIPPVITHRQYFNTVIRRWRDNENVHTVYPKAYYYRDFPKHKIRVVCVTSYDMPDEKQSTYPYNDYNGYNWEQMNWLRDYALRIDNDWSVLVVDHSLPVTTAEGMIGNGTAGQNPLVLRQLLESFKNGTNVHITHTDTVAGGEYDIDMNTNFNTQGARTLIGVLGGHTHIDTIVKINGISYVSTCCGYVDSVEYSGNRGDREGLTYSAVCFDIGTIDQANREVNLYRIGFVPDGGSSIRTFTY